MINVAIAERQRLIRESLATLVNGLKGCQVVGVCATGEAAIKLAKQQNPDVSLIDMLLPGVGALEVVQRIAVADLRTRTIVLGNVTKAITPIQMLQAGALSFLTQSISSEELGHAIQKVFVANAMSVNSSRKRCSTRPWDIVKPARLPSSRGESFKFY